MQVPTVIAFVMMQMILVFLATVTTKIERFRISKDGTVRNGLSHLDAVCLEKGYHAHHSSKAGYLLIKGKLLSSLTKEIAAHTQLKI